MCRMDYPTPDEIRLAAAAINRDGPEAETDYQEAAVIRAIARKQGSILELPDCLIAAVAVRLGLPVVTGNTEHFQAIQRTGVKLTIANWRAAPIS